MQRILLLFLVCALGFSAAAQQRGSSSSTTPGQDATSDPRPRIGRPEAGGSAITLDTSEQLFDLAAGLNACGYDTDLTNSSPVRQAIRDEMTATLAETALARQSRDALCAYFADHELADRGRQVAQYISLSLFISPPPALKPTADEYDMPPDALAVINVLPLLRAFSTNLSLHLLWVKHHAEYEAITDKVHDPITKTILDVNLYLKTPVSSYDGRRFLILVEPLLAPSSPNARIYASDYVVVTSPSAAGNVRMEQIRHLYLHYEVEPLVYAKQSSMARLAPLLKPVQEAPLDYIYKTDVVALLTECLIKGVEARTMDTGFLPPVKPTASRARTELARYDEELSTYDRQAEIVRRKQVDLDMRQGWVLTEYFYNQLALQERDPESLSERMGQMIYGMDVSREQHRVQQIAFLPEGSGEFVRRAPRPQSPMMAAEKMMLEGNTDGALAIAEKNLADPAQNHSDALYIKARIDLMDGDPVASKSEFEELLKTSSGNPHTAAWAHVYLGRLYDIKVPAERPRALAEYKSALAVAGVPPDARAAAEKGLKVPFSVPTVVHKQEEELDPSGKAEKEAYKPEAAPK